MPAASIRAITLDLWGTLIWPRDSDAKAERRMDVIMQALHRAGHVYDREAIQAAWTTAIQEAEMQFRRSLQDLGPAGRWRIFGKHLGVEQDALPLDDLMRAYDQLTLDFLPIPMPGVQFVLNTLKHRYALGLICNVGIADSRTLRAVLGRHGMLDAFRVLTFSDEHGRLKPDPWVFQHTLDRLGHPPEAALHVGDLEELDVEGARAAGMRVARYDYPGFADRVKPPTQADAVFREWSEFLPLLERLQGTAAERPA